MMKIKQTNREFNSHLTRLCMHAESLQLCPILCDLMNCRLPDSSVHGILQARTLEWVTMVSSKGSSRPRNQTHISYIYLH